MHKEHWRLLQHRRSRSPAWPTANTTSPVCSPLSGQALRLFQEPRAKSKFLALIGLFPLFVCVALDVTAEVPRDGEAWIEELSATHHKQDGYIAVYVSEADEKHLEATLAVDRGSGLMAVRMLAEKVGEETMDSRQWNTADDVVFIDVNGEKCRITGLLGAITQMMKDLSGLIQLMNDGDAIEIPINQTTGWQPNFLLDATSISMGLGVASEPAPPWKSAVEDAEVHGFDDDSVTFHSEKYGLLTISREHGLLLRQTVKGLEGEDRVVELKDLMRNPGRDKVVALTSDWSSDGAEEIGSASMAEAFGSFRIFAFQAIVNAVSNDILSPEMVDEWLRFQRDRLGEIVAPWVRVGPEHVEGAEVWKLLLDQVKNSVEDLLWERGEELDGGDAVTRLLRQRATRELARATTIDMLAGRAEFRDRVMSEIFAGQELEAADEAGNQARELISASLAKAYLEAVFDRKANQQWGAVEDD